MTDTGLLTAFIAVTSVAVVLQMLILAGMYASVRKMSKRIDALQGKVNEQVLPLVEKVRGLVDESAPKIQIVVTNLSETSGLVRAQADKIDGAVTEIVDIARTQASNAGVLAARTMARVDIAAQTLERTVTSPMRKVSALTEGVAVGIGEFFGGLTTRRSKAAPSDET